VVVALPARREDLVSNPLAVECGLVQAMGSGVESDISAKLQL
jgi:hypothetical protein